MTSIRFSLLAWFLLATAGCQVDYFAHLIAGELGGVSRTVPIERALGDRNLTDDERAKLTLTQQVRQFGIDHVALTAGQAFTVFEYDGAEPAAYVLSASAKDSLTPYTWNFPFVGDSTTKGFFDKPMGQREADSLASMDYDVFYAPAASFSTLGVLPDPVRQSNLRFDEIELAELILHEMTHATIYKPSDTDFNESLATFVSRRGAQAFFDTTFGADSAPAVTARTRYADEAVIDEYVQTLFNTMQQYYSDMADQDAGRDEIIAGREGQFAALHDRYRSEFEPRLMEPQRWAFNRDMALDNARILAGIAYQGSLGDYQAVVDTVGGDLPAAMVVFAQAAAVEDSRAFLRDFVAGP